MWEEESDLCLSICASHSQMPEMRFERAQERSGMEKAKELRRKENKREGKTRLEMSFLATKKKKKKEEEGILYSCKRYSVWTVKSPVLREVSHSDTWAGYWPWGLL